jgi:hypothetical protein
VPSVTSLGRLPIPVHVGVEPPSHWAEIEAMVRIQEAMTPGYPARQPPRRPGLAEESIDWQALGIEPRWLGQEASDCASAVQPSSYSGRGADELSRFRAGANTRAEVAVVMSTIGDIDNHSWNVFRNDASLHLPGGNTSIGGHRLPAGARALAADGLSPANRDLALRLVSVAPAWWALELAGVTVESERGTEHREPEGRLEPLVTNDLGEVLAGIWISADESTRWYVIPDGVPWANVLGWLVDRGLPEMVPGSLVRARAPEVVDDAFLTGEERAAAEALSRLDEEYKEEREVLEQRLQRSHAAAEGIRRALLYGSGDALVAAIRDVCEQAGITATSLDPLYGTNSADLIVELGDQDRLVEVKSAAGSAGESLVGDLERHLRTWQSVSGHTQTPAGVLVVNHQTRQPPDSRDTFPYNRRQFVESLHVTVVSAMSLFKWWRDEDWAAIRAAMFAGPGQY